MARLTLRHASGQTDIVCQSGLLYNAQLWRSSIPHQALIVTDQTVAGHYLAALKHSLDGIQHDCLILPPGEAHKTLTQWQSVLDRLAGMGAQRDATVIALGGGVIGDLAGFAAASYMRGISVIQVPTTLLAQVDAAIGGKTGVNLPQGKNLVGAFHQPQSVLIDVDTLNSLEARDYSAGLAEVVKYGAIRDRQFLDWLDAQQSDIMQRQTAPLIEMITRSVQHKIDVVEADEREQGQRAILNFGHTFGHALETATGYGHLRHGEAVAIGMLQAARLSARLGWIDEPCCTALAALLEGFDLPLKSPVTVDPNELLGLMQLDKKNRAGRLRLILLHSMGQAVVSDQIDAVQVRAVL
ncbi:MAG: 3-dehydroquinate synthase [Pseudomonadota bacterium]